MNEKSERDECNSVDRFCNVAVTERLSDCRRSKREKRIDGKRESESERQECKLRQSRCLRRRRRDSKVFVSDRETDSIELRSAESTAKVKSSFQLNEI